MVTARLSKLNYRIKSTQGRESVVHVNRMKRAYKQGTLRAKGKGRSYRKHQTRGQELEEEDPAILAPGPIQIPTPQVDNRQPGLRSPNRNSPRTWDTPATGPLRLDAPGSQRADPTYAPPETPRSRRELEDTRQGPPVTRLRSRLQALQEAPDEENDRSSEQLSE